MHPLSERHLDSERHLVDRFLAGLTPGNRVVWSASGAKGTVQTDKSIVWDDGTRLAAGDVTASHRVLIHNEPQWLRVHDALQNLFKCIRRGCTLARWERGGCPTECPEELCPLEVLSELNGLEEPGAQTAGRVERAA